MRGDAARRLLPWMIFFPGLAISLAVVSPHLFDAIRDVADPRLRGALG